MPSYLGWILLGAGVVVSIFLAYHSERLKLEKYNSTRNRLTRLISEADRYSQMFLNGAADYGGFNALMESWHNDIRDAFKQSLPSYASELERLLALDNPLVVEKIRGIQRWLTSVRDSLSP